MAVIINSETCKRGLPPSLERILPYKLTDEIRRRVGDLSRIEEIRLRSGRCASVTLDGRNVMLSSVLSGEEMSNFLTAICDNSLYAHRETINSGYLTLEGGIRVGICGRASIDDGRLLGVYDVSSMNIRIPHAIRNVGEPLCRMLREASDGRGILVYAPPGVGKTTLLSAVTSKMAGGDAPRRVCVIDTRGELAATLKDKQLCLDVLSGYPRGLGIDIATRTMSPELIVCDEIGDANEAEAIISAQNSGVPFIASAHAEDVSGLLMRTAIARLHGARVFFAYVGIKRAAGDFRYTVTDWEEADAILNCSRSNTCGTVCS